MLRDAVATGTGFMRDGKRVDPQDMLVIDESPEVTPERFDRVLKDQRAKVSSPELASLAAKYINLDADDIHLMLQPEQEALAAAVRSLAASVLAQAEGNPRK